MDKNILIIDVIHPCMLEKLKEAQISYTYLPHISYEDFIKELPKHYGLILRSKFLITKKELDIATNLKLIGRVGAGVENIDTKYAESIGIKWFNSPEGNRDAVGEQALGMLLCLLNNICIANKEVKNGLWQREANRGTEIKGKTIGIIGYGNMGSAFAQRLAGFDARVIAYDKYKKDYSDSFVTEVDLPTLLKETDILSVHVPFTEETCYMINDAFINSFHKDLIIINTARGKVLHTAELVKNLKSGKVTAAALDVLEYESSTFEDIFAGKPPEALQYLIDHGNVLLTPHVAGWTHESNMKLSDFLIDKIIAYIKKTA